MHERYRKVCKQSMFLVSMCVFSELSAIKYKHSEQVNTHKASREHNNNDHVLATNLATWFFNNPRPNFFFCMGQYAFAATFAFPLLPKIAKALLHHHPLLFFTRFFTLHFCNLLLLPGLLVLLTPLEHMSTCICLCTGHSICKARHDDQHCGPFLLRPWRSCIKFQHQH